MAERRGGDSVRWTVGAVSRETGLSAATLRAWQRRYGFPEPGRLPSGHRRYSDRQVERLRLLARVLRRGHRIGDLVGLDEASLARLLLDGEAGAWVEGALARARSFDAEGLSADLRRAAGLSSVPGFLVSRAVPLARAAGEAWERGDLSVGQEHLLTQVLEGVLRDLKGPFEASAGGRPLLLATLPGDLHELPLHMVALLAAVRGRASRVLGAQTPPPDILSAARAVDACAVALGVSAPPASRASDRRAVEEVRGGLGPEVGLWLGGHGAPEVGGMSGVRILRDLTQVDAALADLCDPHPAVSVPY